MAFLDAKPPLLRRLCCCVAAGAATAGVDDVWNASPATQDTSWAQAYAAPVNPSNSGSGTVGPWQRLGNSTYTAPADGLVIAQAQHDRWVTITVSGDLKCRAASAGGVSFCSAVIAKGEVYSIGGGDRIWFRSIR